MRSIGRVLVETAVLAVIFAVLMTFAGGVIAILDQPQAASLPRVFAGGLALAFDPVVGVGIASPAWIVVVFAVGLLTYRQSNLLRFAFAMLGTVTVTAIALCAALASAAAHGGWAMLLLGMAVAILLAFLVTAAVALALVYFVLFRRRNVVLSGPSDGYSSSADRYRSTSGDRYRSTSGDRYRSTSADRYRSR